MFGLWGKKKNTVHEYNMSIEVQASAENIFRVLDITQPDNVTVSQGLVLTKLDNETKKYLGKHPDDPETEHLFEINESVANTRYSISTSLHPPDLPGRALVASQSEYQLTPINDSICRLDLKEMPVFLSSLKPKELRFHQAMMNYAIDSELKRVAILSELAQAGKSTAINLVMEDINEIWGTEKFWRWFGENDNHLKEVKTGSEKICDELSAQLESIDENLTFEFGPADDNGNREFIISADGNKSSFQCVKNIIEKAPIISNWKFIALKPPRQRLSGSLNFNGRDFPTSDIYFKLKKGEDQEQIDITLFFDNIEESTPNKVEFYQAITFLVLDFCLGEYAVEMNVGVIGLLPGSSSEFEGSIPVAQLQAEFTELLDALSK